MRKDNIGFVIWLIGGMIIVAGLLTIIFSNFTSFSVSANTAYAAEPTLSVGNTPQPVAEKLLYNPPRPEDAPADIRDAVMLGYNLMVNTQEYAADYVGNDLNCTNCHFEGGISQGGKNGGFSLVGVAAEYPKYRQRQDYAVDLVTRTNDCFQRSENGKPLPPDSKEMVSILTYYKWISSGVPIYYPGVPWLGAPGVESGQPADAGSGEKIYSQQCAACHAADGMGTLIAPPLWGEHSYNDGAGMSKPATLTSFAFYNMPRGNPSLSKQQAADVALFVNSQPRAHYAK